MCGCCPGHEPTALDTVEAFHPQKKKWESLSPMAFPRCSTSFIVIRDRLLVVGGVNQVQLHTAARALSSRTAPLCLFKNFNMFKSYLICCFCVGCCSQERKHISIHLICSTKLFAEANQLLFAGVCRQLHLYSRCRPKKQF